jgi:asparagine N-glycosylation enzyme membrane subunit Stt3
MAAAVSADELSALQPLLVGGAALLALAVRPLPSPRARAAALALVSLGATLALAAGGRLDGVLGFAGRRGMIGTIVESRGLFAFGWRAALAPLSALAPLVPLAVAVALARRGADDARLALAFVALATLAATVQQRRFMHLAALPAAIVLVDAGGALATDRRRAALVAGAAALGCLPSLGYFRAPHVDTTPRHDAVRELADYLATLPTGGVLAQWPYGHVITRFGRQPVVASPLVTPATEPAVEAATRILLDDQPARALAALDARRVRYVIATALPPSVTGRYLEALGDRRDAAEVEARALTTRLIAHDGDGVPGLRELARASSGAAALFVRVAGARVSGSAPPGSTVTARLVLAEGARRYTVGQSARADGDGRFALALPYPTEPDATTPVQPRSRWQLVRQGAPPVELEVSRAAVEGGLTLALPPRG